jgi:catechol 2,3-dioxygenase-like lactoylglutathione lyase family enzyme
MFIASSVVLLSEQCCSRPQSCRAIASTAVQREALDPTMPAHRNPVAMPPHPTGAVGIHSVKVKTPSIAQRWRESGLFSHVMIGTNDLEKAKSFYDALLGTLGVPPGRVDRHRIFYRTKTGTFSVSLPIDGKPATFANGGTIGFTADSAEAADAFHAAGIAHGGKTCEQPPGIREGSGMKVYIAYLRDPDGNKLCALHRIP